MQMSEAEIALEYKLAANKSEQITILAELNGCSKREIAEILQKNGFPIKIRQHRPKTEEEREEQAVRLMYHYLDVWDKEIREHEKAIEALKDKYRATVEKLKERGINL